MVNLIGNRSNGREHMTTEHTVVRSGKLKKKAVQFKCGRPLANKRHGGSEPIRRRRKVPERIDTQTFNVLGVNRRASPCPSEVTRPSNSPPKCARTHPCCRYRAE